MKKLRVYLETSVINFLYADDAPEKRDITREFFNSSVRERVYACFVSAVVIDEIKRTEDTTHRDRLLNVVRQYGLVMSPVEPLEEVIALADAYRDRGAIPPAKIDDSMHVAVATVHQMDALISWNFEHLANLTKERRIAAVNESLGYLYPLRVTTPLEVMGHED
jgi:hypothetical protein